jgi:hypothetical protein
MNLVQLRKVLSILVILMVASVVLAAQPVQAGGYSQYSSRMISESRPDSASGYGYYGGSEYEHEGCGDRSGSESASSEAASSNQFASAGPALAAGKIDGAAEVGRPLNATLSGAEEVPGPGDADGSGTALITLNQGQGQVCWELAASDIMTPTAAHIHVGVFGVAGPVVVALSPPEDGSSTGCTSVDPELIKQIRQNPEVYYVNIHTSDFPSGALRGQLGK